MDETCVGFGFCLFGLFLFSCSVSFSSSPLELITMLRAAGLLGTYSYAAIPLARSHSLPLVFGVCFVLFFNAALDCGREKCFTVCC